MSTPSSPNSEQKALLKAKRAARVAHNKQLDQEIANIDHQLKELVDSTAERLGMLSDDLTSRLLMHITIRPTAQPNPWNGLVHEKSKEWSDMKELHPGGAFITYVVNRIHQEGLYDDMSDEDKEYYTNVAQQCRDAKLNAGSAKTTSARLQQGTVKTELDEIGKMVDRLYTLTSTESVFLAVKGGTLDGTKPTYFGSPGGITFLEKHLKTPVAHLLTLMESSVLKGPGDIGTTHKLTSGEAKSEVRRALLRSLQDAAISTAEDGSPPVVTAPN